MARGLNVLILGDSRSLEKAYQKAAKATRGFGKDMQGANRSVARSRGLFVGTSRSVTGLAASFLGPLGLAVAVKSAFSEFAEAEKVTAQTNAALKSTGGVANVTAKHVDTLATSLLNLSGVDDEVIKAGENVLLTFTRIRNEVGAGNDIFDQATKAALDLSVRMGTDLQSAVVQVGKALQDPIRGITALRRVGVSFTEAQQDQIKALVATGRTLEAQKLILRELNVEFGGSAKAAGDTLPGKLNILRETVLNLSGGMAGPLSNALEKTVDRLNKWLQNTENQKKILDAVRQATDALVSVLGFLKGAFEGLNRITGSTANSLKLLLGAFIAFKTARIVATLTEIAGSVGLIGTNATVATGKVKGLRGGLIGLGKIGVITIAIDLILHKNEVDSWLKRHHLGFATKSGIDIFKDLVGIGGGGGGGIPTPPPGLAGPIKPTAKAAAPVAFDSPEKRRKRASLAYQMSLLNLQLAKSELTASKLDDKAVLIRQAALIRRQIAATKDLKLRTDFYNQLKAVNDQIESIDEEAAQTAETSRQKELDRREKAAEAAKRHAEKVRAAVAKQRAAEAAAVIASQFRALGFTGTGEERVPSAKALRKQLGKLADSVKGTVLDTKETRAMLERIRSVLGGGLKNISREVRERIKQMIDELTAQLDQGEQKVRRRRPGFLDPGFGHGVNPTFGAGGVMAGGVRIDNLNLYGVQDVRGLENELVKRSTTRPQPRRGP